MQPSQQKSAKDIKLEKAAHEFEASLMQELLKPMKQKDPLFSSGDEGDSDSSSVMADYGTQVLAQALSQNGGLGIAKEVVAELGKVQAKYTRK